MIPWDSETFLITPGCQAPPIVCVASTVATPSGRYVWHGAGEARTLIEYLFAKGCYAHNVAFDATCAMASWPDLIPAIFEAYASDRVSCTQVRAKLLHIAAGKKIVHGSFGLDDLCAPLGILLNKANPWRMAYGTLWDVPVNDWPADAVEYVHSDVNAVAALHASQETKPEALADQFRQARAALWLRLMECRGLITDGPATRRYVARVIEEGQKDRHTAAAAGLVRHDGTKDTKAAMRAVVTAYTAHGEDPPLTKTGEKWAIANGMFSVERNRQTLWPDAGARVYAMTGDYVATDEDACLATGDPAVIAYQRYGSLRTTRGRAERLLYGTTGLVALQPSYQSLIDTGRTSCRQGDDVTDESRSIGAQVQNQSKESGLDDPEDDGLGLRECFVPRPGSLIIAVDYDTFELRTWAQCCLWTVGFSKMAEVLNAGGDPHTELGARIGRINKAQAYALRETADAWFDKQRQVAKIGDFGLPGGLGPKTLRVQARKIYRVMMTLDECVSLRDDWRVEWPEGPAYFKWINRQMKGSDDRARATIVQFGSQRVRANLSYTKACNSPFQGLAADAAKDAGFALASACYADKRSVMYGARPLIFAHDEFLLEAREDIAHDVAQEMTRIMVDTAQRWVPNVLIKAQPKMMRRWSKKAKAVYAEGRLQPWGE